MKKRLLALLLVFILIAAVGCSPKAVVKETEKVNDLPEMTIKLSHNQPESSSEHKGALSFKTKLEELSGGKITVEVFPSQQLGSMREQAEAVQMGTHELTLQPMAVLTPFVEELQVVDYPFLWPNAEKMWAVLDGAAGDLLFEKMTPKGFKGIGFWGSGFKQFTTNEVIITKPEDFQGVKMRVMPSPLLIAQYEAWGANPVPIEYAELYNALQQGIVQGQENSIATIAMNKFYEVQENITISNHGFLAYAFIANNDWFNGLPEEYKTMVIEAEKYAKEIQRTALKDMEQGFMDEIVASGINVVQLDDAGRTAFENASKSVHEKFADSPSKKEILDLINSELNKLK